MMNCKEGDIAVIISGLSENIGKEVTCLENIGENPKIGAWQVAEHGAVWRVDRKITWSAAYGLSKIELFYIPDKNLMPLRKKGSDEDIKEVLERVNESLQSA